jgi:hypothetical protein
VIKSLETKCIPHQLFLLLASTVLFLCLTGCSKTDSPKPEDKILVARCIQEPAVVFRNYYTQPQIVTSALDRAPVDQIIETAKKNRAPDLEQLSERHRAFVEAQMVELARWIDTNTVVTAMRPGSAPPTGVKGTIGEVKFPSANELNTKAKSLCIEVFNKW